MLFYKSFVSFVGAIALASTVTASATPVRRTDPPAGQSCSTGTLTCCDSSSPFSSLLSSISLLNLLPILSQLGTNANVGLNCAVPGGVLGCNNQAFCCSGTQNVEKNDLSLVTLGLNCVNL